MYNALIWEHMRSGNTAIVQCIAVICLGGLRSFMTNAMHVSMESRSHGASVWSETYMQCIQHFGRNTATFW